MTSTARPSDSTNTSSTADKTEKGNGMKRVIIGFVALALLVNSTEGIEG